MRQRVPAAVQLSAPIALADAARRIDSSAIRDLLHVIDRPDVISLAGGLPAAETFPTDELATAIGRILASDPSAVQYSATGLDFALGQAPNPASPWREPSVHAGPTPPATSGKALPGSGRAAP